MAVCTCSRSVAIWMAFTTTVRTPMTMRIQRAAFSCLPRAAWARLPSCDSFGSSAGKALITVTLMELIVLVPRDDRSLRRREMPLARFFFRRARGPRNIASRSGAPVWPASVLGLFLLGRQRWWQRLPGAWHERKKQEVAGEEITHGHVLPHQGFLAMPYPEIEKAFLDIEAGNLVVGDEFFHLGAEESLRL